MGKTGAPGVKTHRDEKRWEQVLTNRNRLVSVCQDWILKICTALRPDTVRLSIWLSVFVTLFYIWSSFSSCRCSYFWWYFGGRNCLICLHKKVCEVSCLFPVISRTFSAVSLYFICSSLNLFALCWIFSAVFWTFAGPSTSAASFRQKTPSLNSHIFIFFFCSSSTWLLDLLFLSFQFGG